MPDLKRKDIDEAVVGNSWMIRIDPKIMPYGEAKFEMCVIVTKINSEGDIIIKHS
jgi:hypothetical protein